MWTCSEVDFLPQCKPPRTDIIWSTAWQPEDEDDISLEFARLQKCVERMLWCGAQSLHFSVEAAYQRMCETVGPSPELSKIQQAVERFYVTLELMKLAENTFTDDRGNYVVQKGEMFGNRRYCMQGYVGGGAFCKAWKAIDRTTGELVCIKVIANRKNNADSSRREIKILKFLQQQVPGCGVGVLMHRCTHLFMNSFACLHISTHLSTPCLLSSPSPCHVESCSSG